MNYRAARTVTCFVLLCLIACSPAILTAGDESVSSSSLWLDANRHEDGTVHSDALGKIDDSAFPTVFASAFQEPVEIWLPGANLISSEGGFYAWRKRSEEWIWTAEDFKGWFYSYQQEDWVWAYAEYNGWFYGARDGWQINHLETNVYYVDFDSGDDQNNGLAPFSAWKHAPGDTNGEDHPASVVLEPGDQVLLKGGVVYRGSLLISASGTPGNPIIYKGDAWGSGKAIIDGSEDFMTSWNGCEGSDCFDNPLSGKIYYTDAPEGLDFLSGFFEDDELLWYSQEPNPADQMNFDQINTYFDVPKENQDANSLKDSEFFTQDDADYWTDAYIVSWVTSNIVDSQKVTGFDPASDTISYNTLVNEPYNDRDGKYSMMNHISLIDRPGEYALVDGKFYVYGDPSEHIYSYQVRVEGIKAEDVKHLVIDGFEVRKFQYGILVYESDDVIVRNNEVRTLRAQNKYAVHIGYNSRNVVVDSNTIMDAQRAVGILLGGGVYNVKVINNHVERSSRQGIWVFGVNKGLVAWNTVNQITGIHSNGISVYGGNRDILLAHNRVDRTHRALTYYRGDASLLNLTIFCNYFDSGCTGYDYETLGVNIINNLSPSSFNIRGSRHDDVIVVNNIFNNVVYTAEVLENNISTKTVNKWDVYDNLFHPIEGSPAIDAGRDVSEYLPTTLFPDYDFSVDLDGNKRDEIWDIGPYEYSKN